MNLSNPQKIIVGIFTLIPFILMPYIFYEIFQFVIETIKTSQEHEPDATTILTAVLSFIMPVMLLSILSLALLIFYIIHAVSNKSIDSTERLIWILLFIFFGIISFPIYWIMRIERTSK